MNSDLAWQRWGETDPYYGVLTDARFRKEVIADHRDAFWTSGQDYIAERIATAERHFGAFSRQRALDFGCGVGRLSLPMARHFDTVVGVDVSPAMIEEAGRNAAEAGIANLDLNLSDESLTAAQGRFDLVMSCMVLQHIPVRRGMAFVRMMLERTRRDGVVALQICTDRLDTPLSSARYWSQCNLPGVHRLTNVLRGRAPNEPLMQMNAYPLHQILAVSQTFGFGPALVTLDNHGRFQTAQLLMRRTSDTGV